MIDLATGLAEKAKELSYGMWQRVQRLPDVADFRAAFVPIVEGFLAKDATDHRISASFEKCKYCNERAVFIKYGEPLCFAHKDYLRGKEKPE